MPKAEQALPQPTPLADGLAVLQEVADNLRAYIDQRAAELAAPQIAEAGARAGREVAEARDRQQRAEDLAAELRRQLKYVGRRASRRDETVRRVEALAELTARPAGYDQAVLDCQATVGCTWEEAHWLTAMGLVKDALKGPAQPG